MSDSITGLSNTSYADTYDAKASALTDKLTNKAGKTYKIIIPASSR